jgi:hypothetical protein
MGLIGACHIQIVGLIQYITCKYLDEVLLSVCADRGLVADVPRDG